jgi:molybdopterin synthase sulfur carrier subunit
MQLNLLAFGITKDIVGATSVMVEITDGLSVRDLKEWLYLEYPDMKALQSLLIAVNEEYGDDNYILQSSDEVALIPPVSGG